MKDSAVIYESFFQAVQKLPAEAKAEAYDAYCRFSIYGEEYTGDNLAITVLLEAMRGKIEKANAQYMEKCERLSRNRASKTTDISKDSLISTDISKDSLISTDISTDTDTDSDSDSDTPNGVEKKSIEKETLSEDPELDEALRDFAKHRKQLKKPMTDKAMALLVKKLEDMTAGDHREMIEILNQSISGGWSGVYPLHAQPQNKAGPIDWSKV